MSLNRTARLSATVLTVLLVAALVIAWSTRDDTSGSVATSAESSSPATVTGSPVQTTPPAPTPATSTSGGTSTSAPPTTSEAGGRAPVSEQGPLTVGTLLSPDDIGTAVTTRADRSVSQDAVAEGEGQATVSPCQRGTVASLTSGPAFNGSWSGPGSAWSVQQTISQAPTAAIAQKAGRSLMAWHESCEGATTSASTVTEGTSFARYAISLEGGTTEVTVIVDGTRVALIASGPRSSIDPDILLERAIVRMQ